MTTGLSEITDYSRHNFHDVDSDPKVFHDQFTERVNIQIAWEQRSCKNPFVSFAEKKLSVEDVTWLQNNEKLFIDDTPNERIEQLDFLPSLGYICCMTYSPAGDHLIVGYSSGFIQREYSLPVANRFLLGGGVGQMPYPNQKTFKVITAASLVEQHCIQNTKDTAGVKMHQGSLQSPRWWVSRHAAKQKRIEMRHGTTGLVLCTLRQIQFPPKPVYALEYSLLEERVCYAACMDGAIYRIEVPNIAPSTETPPQFCIKADPTLECLDTQFYGAPGISGYCTPFITQRSPVLSMGLSNDQLKLIVGYADASIKVIDMETQETDTIYKVHKLRIQFIPKKLQRMHTGQVCAIKCHEERPFVFASGAWDRTIRIWDTRCPVGCMMTFEGVNVCNDSIDINRDQCIAGSWQPTDALTVWDLVGKKLLSIVRVQNRRPDVDGEYIYACKYWMSSTYNRKGKYAIIGGSGTNCVEVINLHNRYIACSYPARGSVLAVASCDNYIAFGGTAPIFSIVGFHDPKHEPYHEEEEYVFKPDPNVVVYENDCESIFSTDMRSRSPGGKKKD